MTKATQTQRDWDEKALIQELRQEQRNREMWLRWCAKHPEQADIYTFYRQVQDKAKTKIETMLGVKAIPQTYKSPYDFLVGNVTVEIKGTRWQKKAQRYQADVRHHIADIVLLDAVNGSDHWFIIPMADIAPRRKIEVYSYNVERYRGQWCGYLEAWFLLVEMVIKTPPRAAQLPLGV